MDNLKLLQVSIDKNDEVYESLIKDLICHVPKLKGCKGFYRDGKKHYSGLVTQEELNRFLLLTSISPWGSGYEYSYCGDSGLITN